MNILQPSNLNKRAAWLLGGAAAFVYLYGLGRLPFLGPDEPRYAQVGREMYERGDWVTPTLGGFTWFEKPSLLYWLEIVSYKLFGVSEGAARLGPALCGLATAAVMAFVACRRSKVEGQRSDGRLWTLDFGLWTGLVTATSLGLLAFARAASFDIVLTATVTLALACFWSAETAQTDRARTGWQAGWWVGLGLATLAKGLAGLILPGGIIFVYFVLRREWPARYWWRSILWGAPLMLATAALWYGPVIKRNGWAFVDEFFIQHHFARYTSNKYKHPGPFWYYLPVMAGLALPWTPFLIAALKDSLRFPLLKTKNSPLKTHLALAAATLFAFAWPLHCDLSRIIQKETINTLIQQADARGYGAAKVYHLHAIEHGSWFYANNRVVCDAQGEPLKFEGATQLRDAIKQHGGPVLAFIPLEYLRQLTENSELNAEVIGDNGWIALVAARLR